MHIAGISMESIESHEDFEKREAIKELIENIKSGNSQVNEIFKKLRYIKNLKQIDFLSQTFIENCYQEGDAILHALANQGDLSLFASGLWLFKDLEIRNNRKQTPRDILVRQKVSAQLRGDFKKTADYKKCLGYYLITSMDLDWEL